MELKDLDAYLRELLQPESFNDSALNGLQVEAGAEVEHIAASVDASLDAIDGAARVGAQLLLCHHGLFWGPAVPLTGVMGARVKRLFEHGISLYASHLPLDAHPEFGNNACLARVLELEGTAPFGTYKGNSIGLSGTLPEPLTPAELQDRLQASIGATLGAVCAGPETVRRVAVVSGAAGSMVEQAAGGEIDLLITGEPDHVAAVFARDTGLNLLFMGHYATEVFGVRALATHLEERFGLEWSAVGTDTGF